MPIIKQEYSIKKLLLIFLLPLAALSAKEPVSYETEITFRNFPWGTSMDEVIKKMGKPVSREEANGLVSLVWENVEHNGYLTYMLCYFSKTGLQGGTYYFVTHDQDELVRCYSQLQKELLDRYGPTDLQIKLLGRYDPAELLEPITKELRPYDTSWMLPGGYVHLRVNARLGEPVTLLYSSPELTKKIIGDPQPKPAKPTTAKK